MSRDQSVTASGLWHLYVDVGLTCALSLMRTRAPLPPASRKQMAELPDLARLPA